MNYKKIDSISEMLSVILPAYNEAGRIGKVLSVLREVTPILEIIVVDDGSRDSTLEEVKQAAISDSRVKIIHHETNKGKGEAIFTGAAAAKSPYLLFLDSDLRDLKPRNILDLIKPVLSGKQVLIERLMHMPQKAQVNARHERPSARRNCGRAPAADFRRGARSRVSRSFRRRR